MLVRSIKDLISFIRYFLHFLLGASWAIAVLGALYSFFNFHHIGYILSLFYGGLFGIILTLFFYILIALFEANVKLRNNRS
ncbi:hypothetical protein YZ08_05890 [Campylobacter fetus]|nr:hypothetical protein [Campylobacter fetus]KGT36723.1 hypothetical protein KU70_03665 [Campylobacter fetus]